MALTQQRKKSEFSSVKRQKRINKTTKKQQEKIKFISFFSHYNNNYVEQFRCINKELKAEINSKDA